MQGKEGQPLRARAVQPVQFSFHPESTFATVDGSRLLQLALNLDQCGLAAGGHPLIGFPHKSPGRRVTIEALQDFTSAGDGDEVVVVQIAGLRFEPRPILNGLVDLRYVGGFLAQCADTVRSLFCAAGGSGAVAGD